LPDNPSESPVRSGRPQAVDVGLIEPLKRDYTKTKAKATATAEEAKKSGLLAGAGRRRSSSDMIYKETAKRRTRSDG